MKSPKPTSRQIRSVSARPVRSIGWTGFLSLGLPPFACCLLLVSCSRPSVPAPDALALVNDQLVSEASFRYWWTNRPPAVDATETRQALLDQLVERSVLAQAARDAGLDRDPVVIEQMESLLIARLKETRLEARLRALTIPETELRSRYEADLETKFTEPERARVAVLWLDTRGQAPLTARYQPRLETIRTDLLSGRNPIPAAQGFGSLAIANSEHRASRYRGGDLGWLVAGGDDAWRNTVLGLAASLHEPGEVSGVFGSEQGLFLVRLIERRPAHVRPFESVRAGIERQLLAEQRHALEKTFNEDLRKQAHVEAFPERLAALENLPRPDLTKPAPDPLRLTAR